MNKIVPLILLTGLMFSCSTNNDDPLDGEEDVSSVELTAYADQKVITYSGPDYGNWTLNDWQNQDWITPKQTCGSGKVEIEFELSPNTTGAVRELLCNVSGGNGKINLRVIQTAETTSGEAIDIGLSSRLTCGYPTYVYSATFDFEKSPLVVNLGDNRFEATTLDAHNAVFTLPSDIRGEYAMTVEIGNKTIEFGSAKVYMHGGFGEPAMTHLPVLFEDNGARLLANFQPTSIAQTLAFDTEGHKVRPYVICQGGRCAGIDAVQRIVSVAPQYILATVKILTHREYYDDYTYFDQGSYQNIIIDTETKVCYAVDSYVLFDQAVWAGPSNVVVVHNGQAYRLEPQAMTATDVLNHMAEQPEFVPTVQAKILEGAVYNSSYPAILAAGKQVQLSELQYWDSGLLSVAPMPDSGIFTFSESDKHTTQYGIPVYPRGEHVRILNYTAVSETFGNNHYRHEMYISPIDNNGSLKWDYWDNSSPIGRQYEVYASPTGTYLRPRIPYNSQLPQVEAYFINREGVEAFMLTESQQKSCELAYGVVGHPLLFANQYPYLGNYRYTTDSNGAIFAQPFNDYAEPIELQGVNKGFINAQLVTDGVIFAGSVMNEGIYFKYYKEGQTTPAIDIRVTAKDMLVASAPDFMGWMAAF